MSSQQIAVRLPGPVLTALDQLVQTGRYESRADAVRAGVAKVLDEEARASIDSTIAAGYRRHPQTQSDLYAAESSLRAAIEEEPW